MQGIEMKRRILSFVRDYVSCNGFSPTIREIGRGVGLHSSASVHHYLDILADEGCLEKSSSARSITLTQKTA